jgi:poly(A) polymerase
MAEVMADAGILDEVMSGPLAPELLARLVAVEHALGREPDADLRLSALVVLGRSEPVRSEAARRVGERLRLSNLDQRRLQAAAGAMPLAGAEATRHEIRVALYRLGRAFLIDALLVDWVLAGDPPGDTVRRQILEQAMQLDVPQLPVRGADVLALGVPPGPRVGEVLATFEDWWIGADMPGPSELVTNRLRAIVAAG